MSGTLSVSAPLLSPRYKHELDDIPEEYFAPTSSTTRMQRHRHPAVTLLGIITGIALLTAAFTIFWIRGDTFSTVGAPPPEIFATVEEVPVDTSTVPDDPWAEQVSQWVKGAPTPHFQDNLRDDREYITTWISGGWTNDFMTYINMVYLGLLTSRTPVIPPFEPSHVAADGGFPPFGDVFDIPRLSAAIHAPLLEWRDVKQENSTETDHVGCWSIWALTNKDGTPRHSGIPHRLNLDVAYTSLPKSTQLLQPGGQWTPFWSLAQLGFRTRRAQALAERPAQIPAPHAGTHAPPDERLLCFDFMYYVGAAQHDEWWQEWSPAWRFVGTHARWHPQLERLARGYVHRALGLEEGEEFPLYIGVHVRRGDFTAACGSTPKDVCFQPLIAYARRVTEIRARLLSERGISVPAHHVLVTSDESDEAWWAAARALGWRWPDHAKERTEALHGKWHVPLVDAVIQSMGVGFVGTDRSTMSLVARRRVEDWRGGIGYLVKIGSKDADAH